MKLIAVIALLGGAVLSACGNMPVRLETPSGNPEITVIGETKKAVVAALTNRMLNKGWQIKSADDYHLLFWRRVESMGAMMAFGSNFNAFPEARASYTLVETESGIRVVGNMMMVSNPGSGYEQSTELRGAKDMRGMQDGLNQVAASLKVSAQAAITSPLQ